MRRTTFALLATVAAVCTCLFAATAALAQAPAATISVTGRRDDVVSQRRDRRDR